MVAAVRVSLPPPHAVSRAAAASRLHVARREVILLLRFMLVSGSVITPSVDVWEHLLKGGDSEVVL
jgi:hypothetical protein